MYTLSHLPNLEETLARFQGQYPIVLGYLNMDLDEAQDPRSRIDADLMI